MVNKAYSSKDVNRLEKTFFSTHPKKDTLIIPSKIKNIFIFTGALIALGIIILLVNFNISLMPVNSSHLKGSTDLLNETLLSNIELTGANSDSKLLKDSIRLSILPHKKDGFSINFNEKLNLENAMITIVAKKPIQDLALSVVLRDKNFLSNANNPIQLEIIPAITTSKEIEIPIYITNDSVSNVSLANIKHMRFLFSNNGLEASYILVKNVYLKKGGHDK